MRALLIVFVLTLSMPAWAAKVAILPVGEAGDPARLASALGRRLPDGIEVVSNASISTEQGRTDSPVLDKTKASALLKTGKEHYYDDELADALDAFDSLAIMYDIAWVKTERRIEVALWRTAVQLGLQDRAAAEGEARTAQGPARASLPAGHREVRCRVQRGYRSHR